MTITQVITALPSPPNPLTDTPDTFSTKAAAMVLAQAAEVTELNTWATQANALAVTLGVTAAGGAFSLPYAFSTSTTDSDPGAGIVRLGSATQNASTVMRIDLLDSFGVSQSTNLDMMDDSSSVIKGFIRVSSSTDGSKWLIFSITSIASPSGYKNFTVSPVGSSASSPFANGDSVIISFIRNGDKGDIGLTGSAGTDGATDSIGYTFSSTTTDSDPGAGVLRLSNATQNLSTVIRMDLVDRYGTTQTDALDSMDDSTNAVKGLLRLTKYGDPSKWMLFTLTSIASPSGYKNFTVALVSSSASSPFTNGDNLCLHFSRSGDMGSLLRRTASTTSSSTPTPNCATTDHYILTALATAPTFGAPTGTPTDEQSLVFRIKDNGTARLLNFNAIYRGGSNLVLPSTTIANKTMRIGFMYNAADTKWDLVSVIDNI
jgi:hypothetical protein